MDAEFLKVIERFSSRKILVIGDLILDIYLKGISTRLSPEAPIPIVNIEEKTEVTGGAANTAVNLKALGADVTLLAVLGTDNDGDCAVGLMEKHGIHTHGLLRDAQRNTIVKTRVMSGTHVVTRYDYGTETPVNDVLEHNVIRFLRMAYPLVDAIVISDYIKGVITENVLEAICSLQHQYKKFIAVDSKRLSFFKPLTPSFIKPNYEEAVSLFNLLPQLDGRIEQLKDVGNKIHEKTGANIAAVTCDSDGALVFERDRLVCHVKAHPVATPNVIGAGDTFVSAFTLGSVSGADIEMAAKLACAASYIAVRKEGTASCAVNDLKAYFAMNEKQIYSLEELEQLCAWYKQDGKTIVFTNGCFDILHSGHVSYLNRAKQLGDILIVGINTDDSIHRIKGPNRPINGLSDRMQVLAGLTSVTHIVAFGGEEDDTPIPLIKVVKPDIFVKGGDYTRETLPEAETVEEVGGEIIFLSLVPDHSTTHIIEQIQEQFAND